MNFLKLDGLTAVGDISPGLEHVLACFMTGFGPRLHTNNRSSVQNVSIYSSLHCELLLSMRCKPADAHKHTGSFAGLTIFLAILIGQC